MTDLFLCHIDEIEENQTKGFSLSDDPESQDIFVVFRNGKYTAFRNQCPHTGVSLNWQADQFLDFENRYIQCSVHGALFRVEDGVCLRGPCVNQALTALPLIQKENKLFLSGESAFFAVNNTGTE